MRGWDQRSGALFSYVDIEDRVPCGHLLRVIRGIVNEALAAMSGAFDALYAARDGRRSRRRCCCALLLQAFHGLRSERQLMERLDFDLLFHWFVAEDVGEPDLRVDVVELRGPDQ